MGKLTRGRLIGGGHFGQVFEVHDVETGETFAMKELKAGYDEQTRRRFEREVRLQARIKHKNVVPIISSSLEKAPPTFIMPLAKHSLREYLFVSAHVDESDLWVFYQICSGLQFVHEQEDIIHRDLKPENVLFYEDALGQDFVALSDFGLGRLINRDSTTLTESNVSMGTFAYMAPEQVLDLKRCDKRTDIFALGKILYELLTGEWPYPVISPTIIPDKYRYIIQKACNADPDQRYQTVDQMLDDVRLAENEFVLSRPADAIRADIEQIVHSDTYSADEAAQLAGLLAENPYDQSTLMEVLPQLPDTILKDLVENHMSTIDRALGNYDDAVSTSLDFDYCDVVADFYRKVFVWTDSESVKIMILNRLARVGFSHNRWYVGQVFADLVDGLRELSLVWTVRDILQSDPYLLSWLKTYLDDKSLPNIIRNLLTEVSQ